MGTKKKIINASIELFNTQGYNGTSVRMIASRAEVNVALISYHFGGKKGLLEALMTYFYEGYLATIEAALNNQQNLKAEDCLFEMMVSSLHYQQENHHLARFVHREITLDTMLVRELMTTYLMKEKHLFHQVLKKGMNEQRIKRQPIDFVIIQIRSMLTMPYLHPQYIREVHHLFPQETYFLSQYTEYIKQWVDNYLLEKSNVYPKSFSALG